MRTAAKWMSAVAALGLAAAAAAAEPKAKPAAAKPEPVTKAYAESLAGYVKLGLAEEYTVTAELQPLPGLSPSVFHEEGTLLKADCWLVVRRTGGDSSASLTFAPVGTGSLVGAELTSNRKDNALVFELGKGLTVDAPDRNSTRVYHVVLDGLTGSKPGSVMLGLSKRNSDVYTVLPVSRCQWSTK